MRAGEGQAGFWDTYRDPGRQRKGRAWVLALLLVAFYTALYETEWLTRPATMIGLSSKWDLYGLMYTVAVGFGAIFTYKKYQSSRYQRIRTLVNFGFQMGFAYAIPLLMRMMGQREYYFSYFWPLKMEYLYPSELSQFPLYITLYSIVASFFVVPLMTLRYGKRWYCSWVCGCGALANTAGDSFRHLSSKSALSWRIERVSIHASLLLAFGATAIVIVNWFVGTEAPRFAAFAFRVQGAYGFVVGFLLAAALGVGAYPLLGTRVWCRFACPMAALLGLLQKLGRFRIRVKRDACISCGNCSTYCEMGIDVRAYAERNESFTRASCVGCGVCSHVCPRGVLRLESVPRRRTLPLVPPDGRI